MRLAKRLLISFIGLGLIYIVAAIILGPIAHIGRAVIGPTAYVFYACDNGVHVDLVLPAVGAGRNWFDLFPSRDFSGDVAGASHVVLGWGAKNFYATTKEWSDVRPLPILKALLWLDRSVLHVSYGSDPAGRGNCQRVATDVVGRESLFSFIDATLGGAPHREDLPGYGPNDAFYRAGGTYSLFRTCNIWSAEALRSAGKPMALWSPFSFQVMGLLGAN